MICINHCLSEREVYKIEELAGLFKILSDSNRLKIIFTLEKNKKSVSQIIEDTNLSQPLVSFHLKVLRQANIIKTYRDGTLVFNELARQELIDSIKSFKKFAKDNIGYGQGPQCKPPW